MKKTISPLFLAGLITAATFCHSPTAKAAAFIPNCSSPKSADESGVCEQRRAATAAEALNSETLLGILISGLGTFALLVTVYYSRRATQAATEAATAAKLAIDHARNTSARELRPYIVFEGWLNEWKWDKEDRNIAVRRFITVKWKNVGRTPAKNIKASANHVFISGKLPEDFDFPDQPNFDTSAGPMGPNEGFGSPTADLNFDELRAAIAGEKTLYIWSWVEYDGFETGARYRSEMHLKIELGQFDPTSPDLAMYDRFQAKFNGMDETCSRAPVTPSAPSLQA